MMLLPNYKEHPTQTNYLVFQFTNDQMANTFEKMLRENNIPFEKDVNKFGHQTLHLFGVKTSYRKEAVRFNYLTVAKHRNPLFYNKYIGYLMLIIAFAIVVLIVVGYLNANK